MNLPVTRRFIPLVFRSDNLDSFGNPIPEETLQETLQNNPDIPIPSGMKQR